MSSPLRLSVEIEKRSGGRGVLRCTRADGSVTWQTQESRHAGFFALHDLSHFAVETVLGYQRGFYGLVAEGWDIEDTTGKGRRGPLPPEAGEVEHLVGLLDQERASGSLWSAADFNQFRSISFESRALRPLTDEDLDRVRARRNELARQWFALPEGAKLELKWKAPQEGAAS